MCIRDRGISEVQSGTWNGSGGWYVPSRGEWAAFADQLDITTSNYSSKGLSNYYWSSSQYSKRNAWDANFYYGSSDYGDVTNGHYVRPVSYTHLDVYKRQVLDVQNVEVKILIIVKIMKDMI